VKLTDSEGRSLLPHLHIAGRILITTTARVLRVCQCGHVLSATQGQMTPPTFQVMICPNVFIFTDKFKPGKVKIGTADSLLTKRKVGPNEIWLTLGDWSGGPPVWTLAPQPIPMESRNRGYKRLSSLSHSLSHLIKSSLCCNSFLISRNEEIVMIQRTPIQ
jgi:hypothetical protein